MFKKGSRIIIYIGLGILIAVLCMRNKTNTKVVERITHDTVFIEKYIESEPTIITKYYPKPSKTDTIIIDNRRDIHKTYEAKLDTLKRLNDSIQYRQQIDYFIATTNDRLDTISISTKEEIPIIQHYVEKEIEITKYQTPKWSLVAGPSISIDPKGRIQTTLSLTLGMNIIKRKKNKF